MIHIKEAGLCGPRQKKKHNVRKPRDKKKRRRPVCSCQLHSFFFFCPLINQHIFHVFCSKCISFYKKKKKYPLQYAKYSLSQQKRFALASQCLFKYIHYTAFVATTISLREAISHNDCALYCCFLSSFYALSSHVTLRVLSLINVSHKAGTQRERSCFGDK